LHDTVVLSSLIFQHFFRLSTDSDVRYAEFIPMMPLPPLLDAASA